MAKAPVPPRAFARPARKGCSGKNMGDTGGSSGAQCSRSVTIRNRSRRDEVREVERLTAGVRPELPLGRPAVNARSEAGTGRTTWTHPLRQLSRSTNSPRRPAPAGRAGKGSMVAIRVDRHPSFKTGGRVIAEGDCQTVKPAMRSPGSALGVSIGPWLGRYV